MWERDQENVGLSLGALIWVSLREGEGGCSKQGLLNQDRFQPGF